MIGPGGSGAAALRALVERLASLEVAVESAFAVPMGVRATDYPGGWRPSGLLSLGGRACLGRGEPVAFDDAEQSRDADRLAGSLRGCHGPVGEVVAAIPAADERGRRRRAAAEAALLDLALRQAGRSLAELANAPAHVAIRTVVSFEACPDPAARLRALQPHFPKAQFKVDVDPAWDGTVLEALAATGCVAVLDFKGRGNARACDRISSRFSGALVEDPPAGSSLPPRRIARDQPLVDENAVRRAALAGETINLKAPRMGGFLAMLSAAATAREAGAPCFVGGMFEVGVGRRQARHLAALISPSAGNDLAPLRGVEPPPASDHLEVDLSRPGFGR